MALKLMENIGKKMAVQLKPTKEKPATVGAAAGDQGRVFYILVCVYWLSSKHVFISAHRGLGRRQSRYQPELCLHYRKLSPIRRWLLQTWVRFLKYHQMFDLGQIDQSSRVGLEIGPGLALNLGNSRLRLAL